MIKSLVIGIWACTVALVASYATAMWQSGGSVALEAESKVASLEYRNPEPLTVPMISEGRLRGYVHTRIVFTADSQLLAKIPVDPQPFVLDETFRTIYTDGKVRFDELDRYNLDEMTVAIRDGVNERLGLDLIKDVLFDELTYVDKAQLDRAQQQGG